jgi:molecular chaperone GrpE
LRDMSAENNRHEEEIPIIRPGASKRAADTGEDGGTNPACPQADASLEAPDMEDTDAEEQVPAADEGQEEQDKDSVIAELHDANLRVRADFDNFRKRAARQRLEIADHAKADLVRRLLPPLDNLERALEAAEEHGAQAAWVDGLKMVYAQFLAALGDEDITPIEALGQEFDPQWHEAVSTMPNEVVPQGYITAEVSRGYRLGDIVIRASQVVTSSGAPKGAEEGEETKG